MRTKQTAPKNIEEYIAGFSPEVQALLEQTRKTIRAAAPNAEETIKYQLPTFTLHGNLVHFGAFQKHLGFYPTASGIERFKEELAAYVGAKGSVQFPFDQPVPFSLIGNIVAFRVQENQDRAAAKKK